LPGSLNTERTAINDYHLTVEIRKGAKPEVAVFQNGLSGGKTGIDAGHQRTRSRDLKKDVRRRT
jgi:hypothetical protein